MKTYEPKDPGVWRFVDRVPEPFGCLALLAWAIVVTPFVPLFLWRQSRRRAWFRDKLARDGRIMS